MNGSLKCSTRMFLIVGRLSIGRDIVPSLPPPVFSLFGARWIYDDYQKICEINIETGSIIENHNFKMFILPDLPVALWQMGRIFTGTGRQE